MILCSFLISFQIFIIQIKNEDESKNHEAKEKQMFVVLAKHKNINTNKEFLLITVTNL